MQVEIFDLGLVDFKKAWHFQKEAFLALKYKKFPSSLILCQHYPVITLGRTASKKNILADEPELNSRGIQIYEIERAGDVTYHGPGQLTVYPIFNLDYFKRDIHLYLRYLEEVVIELLRDFGIKGTRILNLTGVWVNPVRNSQSHGEINVSKGVNRQKIASIGIAIRNWITFHGLSINVKKTDLANFSLIRPCGMNIQMTSLETVLGRNVDIDDIKENLIHKFRDTLFANQGTPFYPIGRVSLFNFKGGSL